MALENYSRYFMYGGIALSVIATLYFYFLSRADDKKKADIGLFLGSQFWNGDIIESEIISAKLTGERYGNDLFYDVKFYLPHTSQLHTAKALVNISQIHLVKKGLRIKVKKNGAGKLAVVKIEFE